MKSASAKIRLARPVRQTAMIRIEAGRGVVLQARLRVTRGGLLAIGGLVSSTLLSTAILVHVAARHPRGTAPD